MNAIESLIPTRQPSQRASLRPAPALIFGLLGLGVTLLQAQTSAVVPDWNRSPTPAVRQAAARGDAAAQFQLGRRSELGSGAARDLSEAARWYRLAADQGHAMAQNNLGHLYHQGLGVPKNLTEALKWYRLAAEQGEAYGQANLGWMYLNGAGVARDRELGEQWVRKAAEQNHVEAQFLLGDALARQRPTGGGPVLGNYQVAAEWYEKAAAQGHVKAMFHLGDLYYYGKLDRNHVLAAKWFRAAAAKGDEDAMMRLGRLYCDNHQDLPQDHAEAVRWYTMAARKGNTEAKFHLACLLLDGRNINRNPTEGERLLREAARAGYAEAAVKLAALQKTNAPDAVLELVNRDELKVASYRSGETRLILARAYEAGKGGAADLPAAAETYWQILNLGPAKDQPEAARCVIDLFAQGKLHFTATAIYGPKDREGLARLVQSYRRHIAAPLTQYQIGEMFLRGEYLPEDKPQAVQWLTVAAQQGNAAAMNRLGELWAAGLGGAPDFAEAARWYQRAATNGFGLAQYNLGVAYQNGAGVKTDSAEAMAWLQIAAAQEIAQARELVLKLEPRLSPAEQQRITQRRRELAAQFKNKSLK